MNKPLSEMVIYVLIFIAIVAFNYLRPWLARPQKEQEELARAEQEREEARAAIEVQNPSVAEYPLAHAPKLNAQPNAVVAPAVPRYRSARSYLTDRSNLRHAIIVATVLGPCRAQESQHNSE